MKKSTWIIIGILVGLFLIGSSFTAGIAIGNLVIPQLDENLIRPAFDPETNPLLETEQADIPLPPETVEELFIPFWQTWDLIHDEYIDQPVDDLELMRGAIIGMLESLDDPHSSYMDPEQYQQSNIELEGEYEGIGAWVDTTSEYLTIISPMPGSPADEAGLKPGDQVIKIDGEDMTGIDGSLVIKKVLGPAGSKVVLTILREDEPDLFDVVIIRERITIPSVESEMLEDNIGYIHIWNFGQDTRLQLRQQLEELLDQDAQGLIIDFRNNGGGYLNTAVEVSSEFIGEGVILFEEYGNQDEMIKFEALKNGLATEIPIVLLVNEGSASASEIVAGAIQDYQRGPLVGATTFGKGSVQSWIPLENEQGAVRITIARWLTPNKRQINEVGLDPDYPIELTEDDILNELDPQLDKAVEVMLEIINP